MGGVFMRILSSAFLGLGLMVAAVTSAAADTCSGRAGLCLAACTPALVASGEQYGGTVPGCRASCRTRLKSCMRSGIWVHMGSRTRGMRQQVDRR
jgi:hypothetical protein